MEFYINFIQKQFNKLQSTNINKNIKNSNYENSILKQTRKT